MVIHGTTPGATSISIRKAVAALATVITLATLAGCGGGSSTASGGGSSTASGGGSSTASGDTSSATSGGDSSKAPYSDAEACAWVKENLPTLPDTEVGAQAQLAIGLSSFFEEHGGLENADGYVLDDALSRGCPDVRAAALKKAGIKTFGNL